MKINDNTRVIDLTLGDFLDIVETRVRQVLNGTTPNEAEKRRYVYGLKGLMTLLGCSKTTASRLKQSGKLDAAITQCGSLIIIDAEKTLQLAGNNKYKQQ